MKLLMLFITVISLASCASMKEGKSPIEGTYGVSCGICNYEMTGEECALAINIEDKYYYIEGEDLHEHGNPHAEDGLCSVERQALVRGTITKGVFVIETFELLPYVN